MTPEKIEAFPLICEAAVWLILGIGVTIGLILAFQSNLKRGQQRLPALGTLQSRPFTFIHTLPVMALTGFFALQGAFQASGGEKNITPGALILGSCIFAGTGLLTISLCVLMTRQRPRAVFGSTTCTWRAAIGKGFLYGLAAIPVVSLALLIVSTIGDALDFDMAPQEVFTWLRDPSVPASARTTLILFAVVGAPIYEELLFRGVLLPALMKNRDFIFAALLGSFYFALIHLHGPSFLPLTLLSVLFSAGYAATGSILTPIIMHILFNATALLQFFATATDATASCR